MIRRLDLLDEAKSLIWTMDSHNPTYRIFKSLVNSDEPIALTRKSVYTRNMNDLKVPIIIW